MSPVNWGIIESGDGLSPVRRQDIIWTNDEILSIKGKCSKDIVFKIEKLLSLFLSNCLRCNPNNISKWLQGVPFTNMV